MAHLIYTTVLEALETDHHLPLEDSALWALSFKIALLPALTSVNIICEPRQLVGETQLLVATVGSLQFLSPLILSNSQRNVKILLPLIG